MKFVSLNEICSQHWLNMWLELYVSHVLITVCAIFATTHVSQFQLFFFIYTRHPLNLVIVELHERSVHVDKIQNLRPCDILWFNLPNIVWCVLHNFKSHRYRSYNAFHVYNLFTSSITQYAIRSYLTTAGS